MFEKQPNSNNRQYTSCIKINGIPILPPLVTPSMKKELQRYKSEAICIEKYLERIRKLKQSLPASKETIKKVDSSTSKFELFNDAHSHVDALNIASPISHDFVINNTKKKKLPNLTTNLIDVSEYKDTFGTAGNERHEDKIVLKTQQLSVGNTAENFSPRLVRSDSYTLLNPSPVLLAHIEKQNNSQLREQNKPEETTFKTDENKSRVPNIVIEEINELGNQNQGNLIVQSSNNNSENDFFNNISELHHNTTSTPLTSFDTNKLLQEIDKTLQLCSIDSDDFPKHTVSEDILEQFVEKDEDKSEFNLCLTKSCISAEIKEARKCLEETIKSSDFLMNKKHYEESLMSSEIISYSLTNSSISSPTLTNQSVEFNCLSNKNDDTVPISRSENLFSCQLQRFLKESTSPRTFNCSRELFPQSNIMMKLSEARASEIICAAVKGYLTRRLMRTEKVQGLIQTIKDTLLCAIQLHGAEQIEDSDVELHRRLIQQVSAACCAFHDVFFSLTTPEQMHLIATDRKRKIEKSSKRPLSSRSAQLLSGRSSGGRSLSGRMTQSLTNF